MKLKDKYAIAIKALKTIARASGGYKITEKKMQELIGFGFGIDNEYEIINNETKAAAFEHCSFHASKTLEVLGE